MVLWIVSGSECLVLGFSDVGGDPDLAHEFGSWCFASSVNAGVRTHTIGSSFTMQSRKSVLILLSNIQRTKNKLVWK
jgi:hypothetical protein